MYWLPAIFILLELLFIAKLDDILRYLNIKILQKKYPDEDFEAYIREEFEPKFEKIVGFFGLAFVGGYIYFIVGLFYPIWMVSILFFICEFIKSSIPKFQTKSIERTIKLAKLNGFESSDVKFQRLLKLNELNNSNIKTYKWLAYIFPLIKLIIFGLIIVLHYNFNFFYPNGRMGFYKNVTTVVNDQGEPTGKEYKSNIYIREIERYDNGMSKIKLIDIEIISGGDLSDYEWIKKTLRKYFSTIRKTSEIEWFKSENKSKQLNDST